ncbi:uncharacterized protein [Ptychodera flava]|uniref:uncharacterized protein isoform X2 n=1 Tax=Ptychodera flava TaxID=63121 RepID=UPI00396A6B73
MPKKKRQAISQRRKYHYYKQPKVESGSQDEESFNSVTSLSPLHASAYTCTTELDTKENLSVTKEQSSATNLLQTVGGPSPYVTETYLHLSESLTDEKEVEYNHQTRSVNPLQAVNCPSSHTDHYKKSVSELSQDEVANKNKASSVQDTNVPSPCASDHLLSESVSVQNEDDVATQGPKRKRRRKKIATHRKYHYIQGSASATVQEPRSDEITESTIYDECYSEIDDQFQVPGFFNDLKNYENKVIESEEIDIEGHSANEFIVILDKPYVYDPAIDVDNFIFSKLCNDVKQCNNLCGFTILEDASDSKCNLKLVSLYSDSACPSVKMSLKIDCNFVPTLYVHRVHLDLQHDFWKGLPGKVRTLSDLLSVLNKIDKYNICEGNPDEDFANMLPVGMSLGHSGTNTTQLAYRESGLSTVYNSTIRTFSCSLLCIGQRCKECMKYRGALRKRRSEKSKQTEVGSDNLLASKKAHSNMSRTELCEKLGQYKCHVKSLEHQIQSMSRDIKKSIQKHAHTLYGKCNEDMLTLVDACQGDVEKSWPDPNSFQRLFWNEQIKFNQQQNKSSMRWHPMIIRWCLYIQSRSSTTYEYLRDSGFIKLPSQRTLYDYSHYMKSATGFQVDAVEMLKEEAHKRNMYSNDKPWNNYVGILQDEVKVKEDLVYDHHTGELIGYVDLDKTGNQLVNLEHILNGEGRDKQGPPLAKFVLLLMVRGIGSDLKYPLAAFATDGIKCELLYSILWRAVEIIELSASLKVLFITCDGASPNRKFFNMHRELGNEIVFSTDNIYSTDMRKLYFISDVPHLLKTSRNCFANSYAHKMSRRLWKDGRDISWMHIVDLYKDHCENNLYTACPKLRRSHIDLTAYSQMNVSLAAQVLSSTVANALDLFYGDQTQETVQFIRHMNKFFDCLNTRNCYEGVNKRNENLHPYCDINDVRFNYLLEEFLGYFEEWHQSVNARPGNFSKTDRNKMLLSHQTLNGLKITVMSIVACVKHLLGLGMPFVLTSVFNQDPIEQHFGHYRHKGGSCTNPTVYDVRHIMNKLRVVGATALVPKRGSTRGEDPHNLLDDTPLRKRNANL